MKLGYIHTNKDEQAKVLQVMKMLSESVALEELGIGRKQKNGVQSLDTLHFLNICENCCKVTLFYLPHKIKSQFFAVFYTNIS